PHLHRTRVTVELRYSPPFPTRRSADLSCASNRSARSLAARSKGPEQLGTNRGAKQTRSRPSADPCQRWASAAASVSASSVDSARDRKSTRLNSSHQIISYAVFCLKKKT